MAKDLRLKASGRRTPSAGTTLAHRMPARRPQLPDERALREKLQVNFQKELKAEELADAS